VAIAPMTSDRLVERGRAMILKGCGYHVEFLPVVVISLLIPAFIEPH
jgi:hypothetical protein